MLNGHHANMGFQKRASFSRALPVNFERRATVSTRVHFCIRSWMVPESKIRNFQSPKYVQTRRSVATHPARPFLVCRSPLWWTTTNDFAGDSPAIPICYPFRYTLLSGASMTLSVSKAGVVVWCSTSPVPIR